MNDESRMVIERQNQQHVTLGVVIQSATATTGMTAGKQAQRAFSDLIETLNGD